MSVASAVYDSTCVVCDWVNNIVRRIMVESTEVKTVGRKL